jgi:hypothetical protein
MDTVSLERRQLLRLLLMAPLLSAFAPTAAEASPINPSETFALQPGQIQFKPWQGLPSASGGDNRRLRDRTGRYPAGRSRKAVLAAGKSVTSAAITIFVRSS